MSIHDKLTQFVAVEIASLEKKDKHEWLSGKFKDMRILQPSKRGDVGEAFIVWLLKESGRDAKCPPSTDPTHKQWDIFVHSDDISLEVKTATLGFTNATFQHENLEQNRNYDGLVLLDIAPNELYITCFCKHTIDWSRQHRRRTGIQYKKDLRLSKMGENRLESIEDFEKHYSRMLDEIMEWRKRPRRQK